METDEKRQKRQLICSFCGKPQKEAKRLMAGPTANICDECVNQCHEMLQVKEASNEDLDFSISTPEEIRKKLDEFVIGQDDAKKVLAVAVYNHYKRLLHVDTEEEQIELDKSNVLLIGPTGSGKTFLAKILAKILHVPFAIADATTLTEAGYVGEDVENILVQLVQNAGGNLEKAARGIVYVDEIDKISRKSDSASITRDVSGEGVQQALLKIIEGTVANLPPKGGRKHPQQEYIKLDTTNILFIFGGAFIGLSDIIKNRKQGSSIGFETKKKDSKPLPLTEFRRQIQTADLVKYGLIPEFIGRVPVLTVLEDLTEEVLIRILTEPKNALCKQYAKLLEMDGVELEFTVDAIKSIANRALLQKTGARGLRGVVESVMTDIMYEIPSDQSIDKCIIGKEVIEDGAKPLLLYRNSQEA